MKPNYETDHNASKDELDHSLDIALTKYAAVEPRVGLEERVLANMRAQRTRIVERAWWHWGFAASVALVAVAMFLAWRTTGPSHPVVVNHRKVETQPVPTQPVQVARSTKETKLSHVRSTKKQTRQSSATTVAADPKLDVFPSPQPLTEEELALAQYVRNFPSDARLIAQAQQTSDTEILRKMQVLANESAESN
jgi:hypothetical protein